MMYAIDDKNDGSDDGDNKLMMMISMLMMMTMKVMIDKLKNEYHTTYISG